MKVIYVKESKAKGYISLGVESDGDRICYTVPLAVYSSVGSPACGYALDDETIATLDLANAEYRALKKALSLLSYTDNSERSLYMKLLRCGFTRDASRSAVEESVRLGYINEERQIKRLVLHEASTNLLGYRRLVAKLVSKGYNREKVTTAIADLTASGDIDFEENKRLLLEKRLSDDADDEQRARLIYKYGYNND